MSENKLNSYMLSEMQASFKLTEARHREHVTVTTNNVANKSALLLTKLSSPKAKPNTSRVQESKYTAILEKKDGECDLKLKNLSRAILKPAPKMKIQRLYKRQYETVKNMPFESNLLGVKELNKLGHVNKDVVYEDKEGSATLEERKLKNCSPKMGQISVSNKIDSNSNNFKIYGDLKDISANEPFLIKKTDFTWKHNKYDIEPSGIALKDDNHIIQNYKDKCRNADGNSDEEFVFVPKILKVKQSKLILNLDGPKSNWSFESHSQKRKYCWENNCSISAAESKIRKIYVYGDKNEIIKLKERERLDQIDNTIELAGKNSQKDKNCIYYPFMHEVQHDFTELCVFENSSKGNHVLGVIKGDIEFYGTLLITLLWGQISINGFKAIKKQPLTIYSPRGINWVSIKTVKRKRSCTEDSINLKELNHYFSYLQLENIKDKYNNKEDAIVLFQRNTVAKNLVSIFNRNMAQNIFPQFHGTNRPHYQSEFLLNCLIQRTNKANILQVPAVWAKIKLNKNSRLIVVGGKSVGKSTLVRFLINRHLHRFSRILLIDLDIGQPEVFIPQTISCTLINGPHLGPGFFLNKEPDRAYVVGDINIVMCAEQYVRAVKQLLEYVHKNPVYMEIPWLINTMGYNKGFGQELIAFLIKTIKPTDVVEISSSMSINNFNFPLEWKLLKNIKPIICMNEQLRAAKIKKYALHRLPTMVPYCDPEIWTMSSKDMRYSNILARLSKCLENNMNCFSGCQPFRASLQDLEIIHPNCKTADREELIAGMEANVVYLGKLTSRGLPECLGLAIVRAVDYVQNLVYLSPSISVSALSQVNCIILAGELVLPTGFFKDQGPSVANDVPFVFCLDGLKSSKAIHQIYCRPSTFFKQSAKRKKNKVYAKKL